MWPFTREKTTGMIPNPELDQDPRNLDYTEMVVFGGDIPDEGSVIARPLEVLNQGRTSSCTCHSTVGAIHQLTGRLLSPRWGYWKLKTDKKYSSSQLPYGAFMQEAAQVAVKEGLCDYELLPNTMTLSDEDYLDVDPTKEMRVSAAKNAGGSYIYTTLSRGSFAIFDATIKYMWEQKRPVKIGVRWYKEYNSNRKTGIIPSYKPMGNWTGHDMVAVAWKMIDGEPYIGFIQSWGKSWGDKGMCWMPRNYAYFYSPIAIVDPLKSEALKIEKYPDVEITEKNAHKERANAQELTAIVNKKFPLDVKPDASGKNAVARELFGRNKILFVKSTSYLGWKFTDVVNYLYARSRGKTDTEAYNLNFKIYRKDFFTK